MSNDSCGAPKKPADSCGAPKKSNSSCATPKKPANSCGAPKKPAGSCGSPKKPANSCGSSKKIPSSCGSPKAPATKGSSSGTASKPAIKTIPLELHACMGLNGCKAHDRFGNNECAGMGFCATIEHSCHALNKCRGQGGCGLFGSPEQQDVPGDNPCAWYGSCAVPMNAERLSTDGANSGKSTWKRARSVFEERMTKISKRQVGPSPFPQGPPTWWLNDVGTSSSCAAGGGSNTSTSASCATKRDPSKSGSNGCGG